MGRRGKHNATGGRKRTTWVREHYRHPPGYWQGKMKSLGVKRVMRKTN